MATAAKQSKSRKKTTDSNSIKTAVKEMAKSLVSRQRQLAIAAAMQKLPQSGRLVGCSSRLRELTTERDALITSRLKKTSSKESISVAVLKNKLAAVNDRIQRTLTVTSELVKLELDKPKYLQFPPLDRAAVKFVMAELASLYDCYDDVNLNLSTLSVDVVTEPVELITRLNHRDVSVGLGRFRMTFNGSSETGPDSITAVGIDKLPYQPSHGRRHPHVGARGNVCLGDGYNALVCAARELRLSDVFAVLNAVLNNYNPSSPYKPLYTWLRDCPQCGDVLREITPCKSCFANVCSNCPTLEKCPGRNTKQPEDE